MRTSPFRRCSAWALLALAPCAGTTVEFVELAETAGVTFRHNAARTPDKFLIEAMGSGVAILDFDGDGLLDLFFINGADLSEASSSGTVDKSSPRFWNRLYRNAGNWTFEDVTERAGLAGRGYGMGAAVADFDGDGDEDIFVSNLGPDILYENQGDGTFLDVSEGAGIGGSGWSSGAAFLDFDGDGLLDLFVAGYVDWSFAANRACGPFLPERRSYCHPREFSAVNHTLYRNRDGKRFRDVSAVTGLRSLPGKGLGVDLGDFDGDGRVDVFVANDSHPQQLLLNVRGTRFQDIAIRSGAAYDADALEYAGMGVSWADYNRDLRADVLVNALGRQGYWLYRRRRDGFETASRFSGLAALSELRSGWGMGLVDFDNDGWRDLLVGQGHVMDDISDSDPSLAHEEPLMIARNLYGRFYDVSGRAGPAFQRVFASRGMAFGDLDRDGRVDAVINVNDSPALLLRNVSDAGNSLTVRLVAAGTNRDAVGASVTVVSSADHEQRALLDRAGSYLSSSSPDLHFGMGTGATCERIDVVWPDGSAQAVTRPADDFVVIRQEESRNGAQP